MQKAFRREKDTSSYFFFVAFIWLLLLGFRNKNLGSTDLRLYYDQFEAARTYSLGDYIELKSGIQETGFTVLVWILSSIFKNGQFFILLCDIVDIVAICYFTSKNSTNRVITLTAFVTFLLLFNIQGLRQCLAMSICLFSFEFVKKRKFIPFVLIVVLASLLHRTAIIFLVVYFAYGLRFSPEKMFGFTLLAFAALLLTSNLVSAANSLFAMFGVDRPYELVQSKPTGGYISLIIHIIIFFFSFAILKNKPSKVESGLLFLSLISVTCFSFRFFGIEIAERLSFYYCYFEIAAFSIAVSKVKPKNKKIIEAFAYLCLVVLFITKIYGVPGIYPYKFMWEEMI